MFVVPLATVRVVVDENNLDADTEDDNPRVVPLAVASIDEAHN